MSPTTLPPARDVVAVHMRVHDPADRLVRQLLDDIEELAAERRELRVDDEHTLGAGEHRRVAAFADHHVDVAVDLLHVHLHGVEVLILLRDGARHDGRSGADSDGCCNRGDANGSGAEHGTHHFLPGAGAGRGFFAIHSRTRAANSGYIVSGPPRAANSGR
jgi:hypothetical protein